MVTQWILGHSHGQGHSHGLLLTHYPVQSTPCTAQEELGVGLTPHGVEAGQPDYRE